MTESTDESIAHYYSLHPTMFYIVKRFELSLDWDWDIPVQSLVITLAGHGADYNVSLKLGFRDVKKLKYIPDPDQEPYFSCLFIEKYQGDYDRDSRYFVYESEQGNEFSFNCERFTAEVVPYVKDKPETSP